MSVLPSVGSAGTFPGQLIVDEQHDWNPHL